MALFSGVLKRVLAGLAAAGFVACAAAAPVTIPIGFDTNQFTNQIGPQNLGVPWVFGSRPSGSLFSTGITSEFQILGYRFSTGCLFAPFAVAPSSANSGFMGTDVENCDPQSHPQSAYYPGYQGTRPTSGDIRIDRFGAAFDLLSFDGIMFDLFSSLTVLSSNGGALTIYSPIDLAGYLAHPNPDWPTSLTGPQWTNLTWVEFQVGSVNFIRRGVDNLVLRTNAPSAVPEPGSWALVVLGLGLAAMRRARR